MEEKKRLKVEKKEAEKLAKQKEKEEKQKLKAEMLARKQAEIECVLTVVNENVYGSCVRILQ